MSRSSLVLGATPRRRSPLFDPAATANSSARARPNADAARNRIWPWTSDDHRPTADATPALLVAAVTRRRSGG